jgi:tight adherence protein B
VQVLIVGTFVTVLAVVLGAYWVLILRPENRSKATVRRRLRSSGGTVNKTKLTLLREAERLSSVPVLNSILGGANRLTRPLLQLLEQADVKMTVGAFFLASGLLSVAAYAIVVLMTRLRGIAVVVALIVVWVPYLYVRWKRHRRILMFEERFPEALDLIARAMRAGHAFTTGLGMVSDEVPDPVGSEFKLLHDRQAFGMPLPEALRSFAERVPLLDARFFATAVLTQREAGGNLSEVLDNLARVVRERFKVKRQIRVISAHARMTGWMLVVLPPATGVAMMLVSPGNAKVLVTDPLGIKMVIVALILQVTGGLIVKRLVDIEY